MARNVDTSGSTVERTRRRGAYALAAGAAFVAAPGEAAADVVYSGYQGLPIAQYAFQVLRLDGDDYDDIQVKNYKNHVVGGGNYQGAFMIRLQGRFVGFQDNENATGATLGYASALGLGALIDEATINPSVPQASLAFGPRNPAAQFNLVNDAYLGFAFRIGAPGSTSVHYGWMRVDVDNTAGTFLVEDWAYQSEPDVGLLAGAGGLGDFNVDTFVDGADLLRWQQRLGEGLTAESLADWKAAFGTGGSSAVAAAAAVPEPVTLGLLASGAGGLAILRRHRRLGASQQFAV